VYIYIYIYSYIWHHLSQLLLENFLSIVATSWRCAERGGILSRRTCVVNEKILPECYCCSSSVWVLTKMWVWESFKQHFHDESHLIHFMLVSDNDCSDCSWRTNLAVLHAICSVPCTWQMLVQGFFFLHLSMQSSTSILALQCLVHSAVEG
jgi:hypothetical protein